MSRSRVVLVASVIATALLSVATTSAFTGTVCQEWVVVAGEPGEKYRGQPFDVVMDENGKMIVFFRACAP